ncbi:hypothetical protein Heal19_500175 [Lactiplantibacillus plantarum]|nr:hypothetical protein Heal19_500175 [Lactiplantibacillus plantarum]
MSPSPYSREPARMANERPLNLAQSVVGYFDTETLNETLGLY